MRKIVKEMLNVKMPIISFHQSVKFQSKTNQTSNPKYPTPIFV
jgi:hypothetical protein